ncbi:MAG TPA: chemotaxis protein CheA [Syntrophomonadaceae bacterium]|nr:chemotaxis protein CheA [Syntrophomonadaceae bacterium]
MKMDMSQYLDVFLEESKEHLENLNQKLLELEKHPTDVSALNEIFRSAHTLKGMSSTMGFEDLADLTHHMEDILSDLKEGMLAASPPVVDALFRSFDRIQSMIENIERGIGGDSDNRDLIGILNGIKQGHMEAAAVVEAVLPEPENHVLQHSQDIGDLGLNEYDMAVLNEAINAHMRVVSIKVEIDRECLMKTVRAYMVFRSLEEEGEVVKTIPSAQEIDEGKFDSSFRVLLITGSDPGEVCRNLNNISEIQVSECEELHPDSLSVCAPIPVLKESEGLSGEPEAHDQKKGVKSKQTVRVDIERLDNLMNLVGELVMHKGRLEQIGVNRKIVELDETIEQIDRISTDLQAVVMKVRMVPVEQVFNRFPRMVRDLAKELNKEVDFIIEGKETELDRTVIDEIGDPLIHLLRNAIDHGIESSQERVVRGKPVKGTVKLRARHEGNNVYIEVEDDGGGIHTEQVLQKAIEKGLIDAKEAENLTWEETAALLFHSGFSTAYAITEISGRGVGLDVVKNKIESLSGEIFVDSRPEQGTRFRIKLPLTLAIIQALIISVQDEIYAIPLSSVDETTMISSQDIKLIQNQEVIMLRGTVLPLYRLASQLDIPAAQESDIDDIYVVIVRKGERQIGLVVDTLIGQQEIVIKSLGRLFLGIPGIAGAIVAGDGNVRLILDVATLF